MSYMLTLLILGLPASARAESGYDECPGNKQNLEIPEKYDKEMPDFYSQLNGSNFNNKITEVHFQFGISHLKMVKEDR